MERDQWPSDDPELRDPSGPVRPASDVGADRWRDFGDEPPPAWRDTAPDPLAPIDPDSPVSGHQPAVAAVGGPSILDSPEQDWTAAAPRVFPLLRPAGTPGVRVEGLDAAGLAAAGLKAHAEPLVDDGPGGLAVVYAMASGGFDVIISADHLLTWGVSTETVQDAAIANLVAWSATAPWTDERSDSHRLISSQTGEGWDASRVVLPDVLAHLAAELGGEGRVLVGLPERHLLIAGALRPDDPGFAAMIADFVVEQSGHADEPIERRMFELVDGQLVPFAG